MVQIGGKNVPATNIIFQNWHCDQSKQVDPDQNIQLFFPAFEFGDNVYLLAGNRQILAGYVISGLDYDEHSTDPVKCISQAPACRKV